MSQSTPATQASGTDAQSAATSNVRQRRGDPPPPPPPHRKPPSSPPGPPPPRPPRSEKRLEDANAKRSSQAPFSAPASISPPAISTDQSTQPVASTSALPSNASTSHLTAPPPKGKGRDKGKAREQQPNQGASTAKATHGSRRPLQTDPLTIDPDDLEAGGHPEDHVEGHPDGQAGESDEELSDEPRMPGALPPTNMNLPTHLNQDQTGSQMTNKPMTADEQMQLGMYHTAMGGAKKAWDKWMENKIGAGFNVLSGASAVASFVHNAR